MARSEDRSNDRTTTGGPFGALVRAAGHDAGATTALAAAYAALPREGRGRLIEAVIADAGFEGVAPTSALLTLLSVEPDAALARVLFDAASAGSPTPPPPPEEPAAGHSHARLRGDENEGAAVIVRGLYADLVELLTARWDERGFRIIAAEPMVHHAHASRFDVPDDASLRPAEVEAAVSLVAGALWRHLKRTGEVPEGASRLLRFL